MNSIFKIGLLGCTVFALSGCNTMQVKRDATLSYSASYDAVWMAAIQSTSSIGFVLKGTDKESGLLFAEGGRNLMTQNYAPQLNVMLVDQGNTVDVNVSAIQPGQMVDYGSSSTTIKEFTEAMNYRLN